MKLLIAIMAISLCACHNEERGAWKIVKQRGHDNYGFCTEMGEGFVVAGYTNKESAVAAMEERRHYVRNPPAKTKPKTHNNSMWEDVFVTSEVQEIDASSLSITNTIDEVSKSLEVFTEKLTAAHAARTRRIRDFAYISAVAGYAAATNGVPFERISNHVEKIAVEFFP